MILKGLLAALLVSGAVSARPYFNDQRVPESLDDLRNIQKAVQENLDQARAATVCIEIGEGSGTGVIISPEGLVLTAAHVVTDVDTSLELVMEDGTKHKARSLGLNSETDSAMVQIEGDGPFPYVPYHTKSDFRLGDWVFSLGHSGGFDEARGVVTRVGRLVKLSPATIQSDCVLIGGDSGGPLFDMSGTLIGIHSRVGRLKDDSRHVPLEEFQHHWEALKTGEFIGDGPFAQKKKLGSGFLGVRTKFDKESNQLTIVDVLEDSPAEEAGLEKGMEILEINGTPVAENHLLETVLEQHAIGDEIVLKWKRGEELGEITVELGGRP